jgi:hypothetical protein
MASAPAGAISFDWSQTLQVWDTIMLVTSFNQVPALDYSTWFC